MQYLALIYSTEGSDDVDWDKLIEQYGEFGDAADAAGVLNGGNALQPVSTATSVQLRDGNKNIVDGPFAETKEQLGGILFAGLQRPGRSMRVGLAYPNSESWNN